MSNELQKETAIQNEQQSVLKQKIMDNIIKMLADNQMSIIDAKEILQTTFSRIEKQKVINVSTGWIDANIISNRNV